MRRLPSVAAVVGPVCPRSVVPLFGVVVWLDASIAFANSFEPPSFELPEPAVPPRVEIVERTASPTFYRLPPQTTHFLSRTAIGAHTRLSGDTETDFSLDLLMGAALRFHRASNTALWIEGGYSYVKGREHLAVLGAGVGYRKRGIVSPLFAVVPHVVAGSIDGTTSLGVRTSVIAGWSAYSFEVAHQIAMVDGVQVHELHAAFTVPFLSGFE